MKGLTRDDYLLFITRIARLFAASIAVQPALAYNVADDFCFAGTRHDRSPHPHHPLHRPLA